MIRNIDRFIRWTGHVISWLALVLVLVIIIDVFLRYVFSLTSAASFEVEWHLFAALFLIGSAWTLQQDRHVRVDLFYTRFSPKVQAWINVLGGIILLLPFCAVGFIESLPFVASSFDVSETSPDPGGLPARYVIKSTIPIGFGLLFLQGVSSVLNSIKKLIDA